MPTRPIIIALAIALISGGLGCGGGEINSGQVSVAVTPEQASVQSQGTVTFTAAVTGTSPNQSTAVTWSVEETGGGTVTTLGQYTAPTTAGTYDVIATSAASTSPRHRATVTVTPAPGISVSVTPSSTSVSSGSTVSFTATVTGTSAGQSSAVTWSVQEAGGGTVNSSGTYTAPATAGTYHVIATSVADPTKHGSATVLVTAAAGISVSISPTMATIQPNASFTFMATVSGTIGGQSTAVTWSVQEAGGGTVDASGRYVAPATEGTYHVIATSVADPSRRAPATVAVSAFSALSADRRTVWNPGLNSVGGVPNRTTICANINASTYGNGTQDATAGIQAAINACPLGQVVQLSAGTFTINNDILYVNRGITLRGAGRSTLLRRTNGATPGSYIPGVQMPIIIVGPTRWGTPGTAFNLVSDAAKGAVSVQLASSPPGGLSAGQIVLIDELSGAAWRADPAGRGQIWASSDWRVVYQRHNPSLGTDDPFPDAAQWFSRPDRVTAEVKEVQSYDASTRTVIFTSPFHIDYRTSHTAQLYV